MGTKQEVLDAVAASDAPIAALGTAIAEIATDIDTLIANAGTGTPQDFEDLKAAVSQRTAALTDLAAAAAAAAGKFTPTTPPTEPPIEPPPPVEPIV